MEIADDDDAPLSSDSSLATAAVGGNVDLAEAGGLNLSLKGEARLSRFELDGDGERFMALSVDARRVRMALALSSDHAPEGGGSVTPVLEPGLRQDGGDGETGLGVETAGSVRFPDPATRLSGEGRARSLLAHGGDIEECGVSGTLRPAP